jgi:hypothetical protein
MDQISLHPTTSTLLTGSFEEQTTIGKHLPGWFNIQ